MLSSCLRVFLKSIQAFQCIAIPDYKIKLIYTSEISMNDWTNGLNEWVNE